MNETLLEEIFDAMLDDCYIEVVIGEIAYSPSVAFKRIDPIAYEVAKRDYESNLRAEFETDGSHAELFGDEEE
tara:strand:- start:1397 stop:1615 length:219 start_codon:yes stop_codon:yes gene_type:complete